MLMHACMHTHTLMHACMHTHTLMHAYTHTLMHAHTHTHTNYMLYLTPATKQYNNLVKSYLITTPQPPPKNKSNTTPKQYIFL